MNGREADGDYEKAAALAVWYGDIASAVDVLKRGAKVHKEQGALQYSETMELIMISIAGFRGGNDAGAAVWRKASGALLERAHNETSINQGYGYLQHILRFLMCVGEENAHKGLLRDSKLSLCDRVAFACQFLSQAELRQYLDFCITECRETGNIEGLTITGMSINGIEIIQSFVDRTADVQTAALLTSRVIFPEKSMERQSAWEWLHEYRSLLNRWQMWQIRAKFDVERADLLRSVKVRIEGSNAVVTRRIPINRRTPFRGTDPDIQAPIPAQLDARCNYCSASLGLRRAESHAWHKEMNGVLSSCPGCRKPLPRCSICMLSLGTLNPYVELTNNHANLPFAEWFTWCVRCRHGGHAHHLVSWFSKHKECPISGCDCQCQFDSLG
jgi:WD repeat-containing protein mio